MRGLTETGLAVAVVATLLAAVAWFWLFGASIGAVSSIESNSMSHGPDELEGVLDPGEWRRLDGVDGREDVVTFYEGRRTGHRVGEDFGDVVAYRPNGTEPSSTVPRIFPGVGDDGALRIEHRAIAWVVYNETADAYDVPELGIHGERTLVLPDVGTYDPGEQAYVHRPLTVTLDPDRAGRHDGFVTKGDNNPVADQDRAASLATVGTVELVTPERVDGRVADHVDASTIRLFQFGVPVAAAMAAGGVYAWRRGRLDPLLPDVGERDTCTACNGQLDPDQPFCPACGEET